VTEPNRQAVSPPSLSVDIGVVFSLIHIPVGVTRSAVAVFFHTQSDAACSGVSRARRRSLGRKQAILFLSPFGDKSFPSPLRKGLACKSVGTQRDVLVSGGLPRRNQGAGGLRASTLSLVELRASAPGEHHITRSVILDGVLRNYRNLVYPVFQCFFCFRCFYILPQSAPKALLQLTGLFL